MPYQFWDLALVQATEEQQVLMDSPSYALATQSSSSTTLSSFSGRERASSTGLSIFSAIHLRLVKAD
jgi:hypothetical protein